MATVLIGAADGHQECFEQPLLTNIPVAVIGVTASNWVEHVPELTCGHGAVGIEQADASCFCDAIRRKSMCGHDVLQSFAALLAGYSDNKQHGHYLLHMCAKRRLAQHKARMAVMLKLSVAPAICRGVSGQVLNGCSCGHCQFEHIDGALI